jgi:hypothetical protein
LIRNERDLSGIQTGRLRRRHVHHQLTLFKLKRMLLSPIFPVDLLSVLLKSSQLLPLQDKPPLKALGLLLVLEGSLILCSSIHSLFLELESVHLSVGALEAF